MSANFVSCGCYECKLIADYLHSIPNINEKLLLSRLNTNNSGVISPPTCEEDVKSDLTTTTSQSVASLDLISYFKVNEDEDLTFLKLDVDDFLTSLDSPSSIAQITTSNDKGQITKLQDEFSFLSEIGSTEESNLNEFENNNASNSEKEVKSLKDKSPKRRRRGSNNSSTTTAKKRTKRSSFPGESKVIVWKWNKSTDDKTNQRLQLI
ncbi:predicted protein [Naegleria gruberi]|uniref:Predicted protein n=1 Tax=Naegleria gruberi TaxID=5762 RepID=D2UY88_NAEGR|nr:uncharacterized protein NAEGRDRAFT_61387 [Naegleria gruberi]EFC50753.1 predicted protein [Naegleria gruberi]|eukprot:XP_002683497.1 predicted protein [Naegleria gruberi strain NEG-M]